MKENNVKMTFPERKRVKKREFEPKHYIFFVRRWEFEPTRIVYPSPDAALAPKSYFFGIVLSTELLTRNSRNLSTAELTRLSPTREPIIVLIVITIAGLTCVSIDLL